jgi:hypothetical protein
LNDVGLGKSLVLNRQKKKSEKHPREDLLQHPH